MKELHSPAASSRQSTSTCPNWRSMPFAVGRCTLTASQSRTGRGRLSVAYFSISLTIPYHSRAQQQVPEREDIARALMELFSIEGRPEQAAQVFQRLTRTLQDQFRIQPASQTRAAYEAIIAKA